MPSCFEDDYYTVSEIKLSYYSKIRAAQRPRVTCSQDSYAVFRRHWEDDQIDFIEQSKLMLLNRANRVLGLCHLSSGSTTATHVDIRIVFAAALKANASSIILAHNHPSENLEPSNADRQLTNQLKEAGTLMNIPLLDHIIVTRRGYYSFADEQKYDCDETLSQNRASKPSSEMLYPCCTKRKKQLRN